MHWVTLINHFDSFLEKQCKLVSLRFDLAYEGKSDGIHVADCLAVLRVTSIILENTANKQMYQSAEVGNTVLRMTDAWEGAGTSRKHASDLTFLLLCFIRLCSTSRACWPPARPKLSRLLSRRLSVTLRRHTLPRSVGPLAVKWPPGSSPSAKAGVRLKQ